jgi:hypothetical protein
MTEAVGGSGGAVALSPYSCPSAQPDMLEARVIGVLSGSASEPRIAYLAQEAVIPAADMPPTLSVDPVEAFRFAARCEDHRCAQHVDGVEGGRCGLGARIVAQLDPVVASLPSCTIRASCRWYAEQGREACLRCPQVVTLIPRDGSRLSRAAQPAG